MHDLKEKATMACGAESAITCRIGKTRDMNAACAARSRTPRRARALFFHFSFSNFHQQLVDASRFTMHSKL